MSEQKAMSIKKLQDEMLSYLRKELDKKVVKTMEVYGGEFDIDEIKSYSFTAPAVFITTLGWMPSINPAKPDGRDVRMAAFVATKHAKHNKARMQEAAVLVELIEAHLSCKRFCIKGSTRPKDIRAENLYDREVDNEKHALWLLSWTLTLDKPTTSCITQLYDWLVTQLTSVQGDHSIGPKTEIDMTKDNQA